MGSMVKGKMGAREEKGCEQRGCTEASGETERRMIERRKVKRKGVEGLKAGRNHANILSVPQNVTESFLRLSAIQLVTNAIFSQFRLDNASLMARGCLKYQVTRVALHVRT